MFSSKEKETDSWEEMVRKSNRNLNIGSTIIGLTLGFGVVAALISFENMHENQRSSQIESSEMEKGSAHSIMNDNASINYRIG